MARLYAVEGASPLDAEKLPLSVLRAKPCGSRTVSMPDCKMGNLLWFLHVLAAMKRRWLATE